MITEEQIEKIVEKLINRIEEANTIFLKSIGSSIKTIKELTPSQAQQLIQILKYGGKYEDIVREIAKLTKLNVNDIDKIFSSYAKKDQLFYEKFYKYKDIEFIPFEQNSALKTQTMALSNIVKNEMYNFSRNNVLGYAIDGKFVGLRETYNKMLDIALLNVGQGKETFDSAMTDIMKQVGRSGLKTIVYDSTYVDKNGKLKHRTRRLDSAVRMHLKSRLRELHSENQKIISKEFGANGVEISVHPNPAPDHEKAQGRQFSFEEYDKLNSGFEAMDYKGNIYTLDHDYNGSYRPIHELNCYHTPFYIVLGVSKPEYTDEQLQQIIDDNEKGFEFEGKHYTNYEGTQLQRNLERAIREQKDIQILAKESDTTNLIDKAQQNITVLTNKYRKLSEVSKLPTKTQRLRVSGYRRTKVIQKNKIEIEYARKNNKIWHSTENLEEIINSNQITTPSLAVGEKINNKIKYGSQFIEFKPEILENVDKSTILYKGDGGNKFKYKETKFDNLIKMLKDSPKTYNELKFDKNIESLKYIKKVYIRQDEPQKIIDLLKENNIEYEIYKDYRVRGFKKKR